MDRWAISPAEKAKLLQQFNSLGPANGFITGDKAKGLMLQSQLSPPILAQIWGLADADCDGKLNMPEFFIACKLISLKLQGVDIPAAVPQTLKASAFQAPLATPNMMASPPLIPTGFTSMTPPLVQPMTAARVATPPLIGSMMSPSIPTIQQVVGRPVVPVAPMLSNQQLLMQASAPTQPLADTVLLQFGSPPNRSVPVPSFNGTPTGPPAPLDLMEWAIPQPTKLKYTQVFNSLDKTMTGFLTGVQARGILVQSQLPQITLAKIWSLSDIDADGRLACEEFILAMHLCELARANEPLPTALPPNLIPPSFRKPVPGVSKPGSRLTSIGSIGSFDGEVKVGQAAKEDPNLMSPVSFEDRRKENFDKGQAELERRRKALEDAQRREREERERKEREEMERQEKIRLEQERRKQEEMQRQLEKQREVEMEREKERLRQIEQREAARRELERQRQVEWESQRLQELLAQRQAEMEKLTTLRAKNQSLTLDLCQLHDKVTEMSRKITETRSGVAEVKSSIDGMRGIRDSHVAELTQLKARMRDQNARLLTLTQERAKIEARNKMNAAHGGDGSATEEVAKKQLNIAALKEKLAVIQDELSRKQGDQENNNQRHEETKAELKEKISEYKRIRAEFEAKRSKVLELRANQTKALVSGAGWESNQWDASPTKMSEASWGTQATPVTKKYRALYGFDARNGDELSFSADDIIVVTPSATAEPGWLSGELNGQAGWFPEAYVEPYVEGSISGKRVLEGIQEVPETWSDNSSLGHEVTSAFAPVTKSVEEVSPVLGMGQAVPNALMEAIYDWTGIKGNHLSFMKGDVITVTEKQGEWSYGSVNGEAGWFPNTHVIEYTEAPAQDTSVTPEEYVALYPYQSPEIGDLIFEAGETVVVTHMNGDWWTGRIGDRVGIFPSNYVEKASNVGSFNDNYTKSISPGDDLAESELNDEVAVASAQNSEVLYDFQSEARSSISPNRGITPSSESGRSGKKPEIATVVAPYTAVGPNQLNLQRGQLVLIRKKNNSGWWEGELQAKGRKREVGWFPSSYVRVMTSSGSARSTPVQELDDQLTGFASPVPAPIQVEKVIAVFPYTAQNDDELTLKKDDIIIVINKDDPSWWQGELNGVVGLFPSNYVEEMSAAKSRIESEVTSSVKQSPVSLSGHEKKRQACIRELIQSEETFVQDLVSVVEVFQLPIINSRLLTDEEVKDIFVNWEDLVGSSNRLVKALRLRRKNCENGIVLIIGDILCESLPNMTPYIRYCSRQLGTASFIQNKLENSKDFHLLIKRCQLHAKAKGLPLSAFLLQPMQRITKYPILLKEILKYTPPTHPDRHNLEEALTKAELLCTQVNDGVKHIENAERLEWIQKRMQVGEDDERIVFNSITNIMGQRVLLHHGFLRKTKSGKELIGFLFNDFLLLTEPSKQLEKINFQFFFSKESKLLMRVYKEPILLEDLKVQQENTDSKDENTMCLCATDRKIYVSFTNLNEKNLWLKKIDEACKKRIETEKVNLQRQGSSKCNSYCQVTLGSQLQRTDSIQNSMNPKWNSSMQFQIKDLKEDVLCLTVFGKDSFRPDEYLGRAEIRIQDMLSECKMANRPLLKKLPLYEVSSGEVWIKFDIQLFSHAQR